MKVNLASLPAKLFLPFTMIVAVPAFVLFAYSTSYSDLLTTEPLSIRLPNCLSVLVIAVPVYSSALNVFVEGIKPVNFAAEISAFTRLSVAVVLPFTFSLPVLASIVTV